MIIDPTVKKIQPPIIVGNLAVAQYLLHRDGIDLPQWYVETADGKLIFGPFSSLEQAMETARAAQNIPTEGRNEK